MNAPDNERAEQRRRLIAERVEIDDETKTRLDAAIVRNLLVYLESAHGAITSAITLGLYLPIQGEPDLTVLTDLWPGFVALPAVTGRDEPLTFLRYTLEMPLVEGAFGTRVPADPQPIEPRIILAPCVGFAREGGRYFRLGFGGGYYDRTLAARPMPLIGIAYSFAALDGFKAEPHDMPLSAVITENGVLS